MKKNTLFATTPKSATDNTNPTANIINRILGGDESAWNFLVPVIRRQAEIAASKRTMDDVMCEQWGTHSHKSVVDHLVTDVYEKLTKDNCAKLVELSTKSDSEILAWMYRYPVWDMLHACSAVKRKVPTVSDFDFDDVELHSDEDSLLDSTQLDALVDQLSSRQRLVVQSVLDPNNRDCSHSELAEMLGIPVGTFNKAFYDAKRSLATICQTAA